MSIFLWQRTWHINVWKMVGGTCPHWDFRGSLFVSGTMLKQSQRSRPVSRKHANHFLSIVRHTNAEKMYHQCGQLTQFHCTIVTVVQHTVFDVQASKRLFYTYNTVVLFNNYYNYYYCCGRVCPCCCRLINVDTYATCHMHALSTLELRGGPEHARAIWFTLTAPFVKRLWKLAKPITN